MNVYRITINVFRCVDESVSLPAFLPPPPSPFWSAHLRVLVLGPDGRHPHVQPEVLVDGRLVEAVLRPEDGRVLVACHRHPHRGVPLRATRGRRAEVDGRQQQLREEKDVIIQPSSLDTLYGEERATTCSNSYVRRQTSSYSRLGTDTSYRHFVR